MAETPCPARPAPSFERVATSVALTALLGLLGALPSCDAQVTPRALPQFGPAAFRVESIRPADRAEGVHPDAAIEIVFTNEIDTEALGENLLALKDLIILEEEDSAARVEGAYELSDFNRRVRFQPARSMSWKGLKYRLRLLPQLVDTDGQALRLGANRGEFVFTTLDDASPPDFGGIREIVPVCGALIVSWDAAKDEDDLTPAHRMRYQVHVTRLPDGFEQELVVEGLLKASITGVTVGFTAQIEVKALDLADNPSVADLESAPGSIGDSEPPRFAGAIGLGQTPDLETTHLRVNWQPAADNCETPLVYRIYLKACVNSDPGCDGAAAADCADAVQRCDVSPAECAAYETTCRLQPSECAVRTEHCSLSAAEVVAAPDRLIDSIAVLDGSFQHDIPGLLPNTRYAVVVRARDGGGAGNEDDNLAMLQATTGTTAVSFVRDVSRVIARARCSANGCHDARFRSGGLSLVSLDTLLAGGNTVNPPIVTPGDPQRSTLYLRISSEVLFGRGSRMPPCSDTRLPLCEKEIELVRRWIEEGELRN